MELFFIWIAIATVTGLAANGRGRSFFGWFCLGFLFSFFALIAVLVMQRVDDTAPTTEDSGPTRKIEPRSTRTLLQAPVILDYRGHKLRIRNGMYWIDENEDQNFRTEIDAKRWIDAQHPDAAPVSLRRTPPRQQTPAPQPASRLPRARGDGFFDQLVVGTKNYQDAIRALPTNRSKFLVTLHCQPDNPHDRNAVAVMNGTDLLGFLPREDAIDWRRDLEEEGHALQDVQAYAQTVTNPEHDNIGLRLDIDTPLEVITPRG